MERRAYIAVLFLLCCSFVQRTGSFAVGQARFERKKAFHENTLQTSRSGARMLGSINEAVKSRKYGALSLRAVAFEPVTPNLAQTAVVLFSTVGLAAYWWLVFVPGERRDLAVNKNKGGLNSYLEELESSSGRDLEKWFYTEWLRRRAKVRKLAQRAASKSDLTEEQIQKAIPTPNFFSLDNPVLVAVLVMMSGVAFAGLSGR